MIAVIVAIAGATELRVVRRLNVCTPRCGATVLVQGLGRGFSPWCALARNGTAPDEQGQKRGACDFSQESRATHFHDYPNTRRQENAQARDVGRDVLRASWTKRRELAAQTLARLTRGGALSRLGNEGASGGNERATTGASG